jgi:hypothetical protein
LIKYNRPSIRYLLRFGDLSSSVNFGSYVSLIPSVSRDDFDFCDLGVNGSNGLVVPFDAEFSFSKAFFSTF